MSVLVFVLTGTAWGLYRDLIAGLTTTDVIFGGSDGNGLNILLVGVDSRTDARGNPLSDEVLAQLRSGAEPGVLNSDTIIMLHLPAGGGSGVAFSIPRDSYVDIPGYRADKINAAYPATKALTAEELVRGGVKDPAQVEQRSAAAGRSALIKATENLTGLHVDHYAEVNLLGFYDLTSAIGGVDVCLNAPVDEPLSGARFPAGPQTISGADALAFVRQRHDLPEGDLSRIRRQQVFLAAVAAKVLSRGTLTNPRTLGALIDVAQKSLVIDSGWDILGFAHQASNLAAGRLEFLTIPTRGGENNARGDVVVVDPRAVQTFVEQHLDPQAQPPTEPAATPAVPPAVTVDVGNASGVSGQATEVTDRLATAGYGRGTATNASPRSTSVVRYGGDGSADAARAVAAQLGNLPVERSAAVPTGRVQVLLGADFSPPAAPGSATTPAPPDAGKPINAAGVPCID